MSEICRKTVFFLHFLEFSSVAFSDFLQKDAYLQCSKHGRVRFLRKNFFRLKMPEIAVFADFHYMFSLYFYVLHRKTLLITMLTIKHDSIVNKTDFCDQNFLLIFPYNPSLSPHQQSMMNLLRYAFSLNDIFSD